MGQQVQTKPGDTATAKRNLEHLHLSSNRDYKVYNVMVDGSLQIMTDRGVMDYFHPSLFKITHKA